MEQIEDYKILPLGRSKDLTNQIFGDFKVLYRTENPLNKLDQRRAYWLCQCECGNQKIIPGSTLRKGKVIHVDVLNQKEKLLLQNF